MLRIIIAVIIVFLAC